jgi:hypothetical protein
VVADDSTRVNSQLTVCYSICCGPKLGDKPSTFTVGVMTRKIVVWLLWIGLVVYAFGLAPSEQPDTFALIQRLIIGQWQGINPLIISLFNLMGIWPLVYSCVVLIDGRSQKIPAWPFALGSLAVGAFALIPYLALREPGLSFTGEKNGFLNLLDSRWTGILLTLGAVGLVCFGLIYGDWPAFVQEWQTRRFIHVMSLDFCLLCLLFPILLGDDMARRGIKDSKRFWVFALVPLLGPLAYLCSRPSLPVTELAEVRP